MNLISNSKNHTSCFFLLKSRSTEKREIDYPEAKLSTQMQPLNFPINTATSLNKNSVIQVNNSFDEVNSVKGN